MVLCFCKESRNVVKLFNIIEKNGKFIPAYRTFINTWDGKKTIQWVDMPSDLFDSEKLATLSLMSYLNNEGYSFVGTVNEPNAYIEELQRPDAPEEEYEEVIPEEV